MSSRSSEDRRPEEQPHAPSGARAEYDAADAAGEVRALSERVTRSAAELHERARTTQQLLVRAERALVEAERTMSATERTAHEADLGARAAHIRADHGNRLLGAKGPEQSLEDPPRSGVGRAQAEPDAPSRGQT